MKIVIHKNTHYPYLIPLGLPIYVKKNTSTFRIANFMFSSSCLFDLHNEDEHDVNKLFGFSIGHHHKGTSFRFGWRPIINNNTIEIVAYEYHDGIRQRTISIREVGINEWHEYMISYNPIKNRCYYFIDKKTFYIPLDLKKKHGLGYTLGIYFGGNEKAPQKITIFKKK